MFGRLGLHEIAIIVFVVIVMMYPTFVRTADNTPTRSTRRSGARTVEFPHADAFWPLTIFAFVSLVAFAATIIVTALLTQ